MPREAPLKKNPASGMKKSSSERYPDERLISPLLEDIGNLISYSQIPRVDKPSQNEGLEQST